MTQISMIVQAIKILRFFFIFLFFFKKGSRGIRVKVARTYYDYDKLDL